MANYTITQSPEGFIVESRGPNSRNSEYKSGIQHLLLILQQLNKTVKEIKLISRPTLKEFPEGLTLLKGNQLQGTASQQAHTITRKARYNRILIVV